MSPADRDMDGLLAFLLVVLALALGAIVGCVVYIKDAAAWNYVWTLAPAAVIGGWCRVVFLVGSGVTR